MTMRIDKGKVRRHFDRHAGSYDQYAVVQRTMADYLLELTLKRKAPEDVRRIIEIGCGTGLLTGKLLDAYPEAIVLAIDLSPQMVECTRLRYSSSAAGRLEVLVGDAEPEGVDDESALKECDQADLIISSAVFQWFDDPERTLKAWLGQLSTDGLLAFATFGPQTFGELHEAFRAAERELGLPEMSHGQDFLSLSEWEMLLRRGAKGLRQGLTFTGQEALEVQAFEDVRTFLYSVKRVGAGNANSDSGETQRAGRRLFAEMEKKYTERFAMDEGIRATYHLLYGFFGAE
ncbi:MULTISPECIES: malonyl-ACP O-methyltransferase BioC [unclassified Paenibacillus]|uniref:malonyl-ACP O-methyltransferase BioC n=1 Tax=unclassified Paenibacillus TaxID=185978 RepID=UPI001B46D48B|nr:MULTISPECIES: malonyl-ACP O-methyltransferase BioC [unclassified Paenibacillus]MBP1157514.1 malonyl-CoA O-methyltransferase [Paenibacillus sp. PvP091]MBP1171749.1 malonyl-CoA O-methyltransferase [Paenibacillus sp. PvR098]MBP2438130.1 malonyl-CoA O-methyltransferase [Paenibacillus sp. PvP052]